MRTRTTRGKEMRCLFCKKIILPFPFNWYHIRKGKGKLLEEDNGKITQVGYLYICSEKCHIKNIAEMENEFAEERFKRRRKKWKIK